MNFRNFGMCRTSVVAQLFALMMCAMIVPSHATPSSKLNAFWADSEPKSGLHLDHSAWQHILDQYLVTDHPSGINRFNYAGVTKQDKLKLAAYIAYVAQFDPRQLSKLEQKAMWLNLYNVLVVATVLNQQSIPDVDSIRRVGGEDGPWKNSILKMVTQEISLDAIEHNILRPIWNDPRIHFALNRATLGSANLQSQVFTYQNIDAQLDKASKEFVNSSRGVSFSGNRIVLSTIFNWYSDDFGGGIANVKKFLSKYAAPELAIKISRSRRVRYRYQWDLNRP
jgi:hypothetical protein